MSAGAEGTGAGYPLFATLNKLQEFQALNPEPMLSAGRTGQSPSARAAPGRAVPAPKGACDRNFGKNPSIESPHHSEVQPLHFTQNLEPLAAAVSRQVLEPICSGSTPTRYTVSYKKK